MARPIPTRFPTALGALVLLATALCTPPAHATQITVTTTDDEANTDGDCSLREAFRAANTNTAQGACPAGSNTSTDEIVLTSDAVYSLTIAGSDNLGLVGSLVVQNNTATTDVEVTVAGGGTATISQDAVPDTRVLVVGTGAHLDLTDVVVENGTITGSNDGGGIFVAQGAQLALLRCLVRRNVSAVSGGAIRNNGGTLIIEDSAFDHNVAASAGGAISNGSNTSTLIRGTLFAENEANGQFDGGGAISSADQISIVESVFVNNRAKTLGGAIAHFHDVADEASISQSCFVGNEADFTHHAVDVFNGSVTLNAAGIWWGADDGPSGAGPGSGDGIDTEVDFDPPANVPDPSCLAMEMVANGGFQSDGNGDDIPERWTPTGLTPNDGRVCNSGACLVKLRGNGLIKRLVHDVKHAGAAGDVFTFRARSRAQDVPASGGVYRAVVTIFHSDGSKQSTSVNFSPGKHGFERLTQQLTASEAYTSLQVAIEYGRSGGVVRFDSVSLLLEE